MTTYAFEHIKAWMKYTSQTTKYHSEEIFYFSGHSRHEYVYSICQKWPLSLSLSAVEYVIVLFSYIFDAHILFYDSQVVCCRNGLVRMKKKSAYGGIVTLFAFVFFMFSVLFLLYCYYKFFLLLLLHRSTRGALQVQRHPYSSLSLIRSLALYCLLLACFFFLHRANLSNKIRAIH